MPIRTLQQRLTQVGVIRLGQKVPTASGKIRPAKLETLRFTSPSKTLIDAVAAHYGGQVKPWTSPTGPEFEVVTDAREIPVLVPPQRMDPNLEHWGNGYRDRLCDGETELMRQKPCLCAATQASGQRVDPRELCKPTTRMSLMLADIPSMGTFKLESKGWNAAAELPTLSAAIESAPKPIPARLEVQVRQKKLFHPGKAPKDQIESRTYMVPVLHFDFVTPAQAFGGQIGAAAQTALAAGQPQRAAIGATAEPAPEPEQPARARKTTAHYIAMAKLTRNVEQVRSLWKDAAGDGALTDDLKELLTARRNQLKESEAPKPEQPPVTEVVDAEIVEDDPWTRLVAAAGAAGLDQDGLEQHIQTTVGKISNEVSDDEIGRCIEALGKTGARVEGRMARFRAGGAA